MRINSPEELKSMQEFYSQALNAQKKRILVCAGTGCVAGGSLQIYARLKELMEEWGIPCEVLLQDEADGHLHTEPAAKNASSEQESASGVPVGLKKSGCHGFCEMGPLLQIEPDGILYTHVQVSDCGEIIDKTLLKGELVERLLYQLDGVTYAKHDEIPFYKKQHRVVLENCGSTDAEDIDEYIARDGYSAFEKALFEMTDEEICKEISDSGL